MKPIHYTLLVIFLAIALPVSAWLWWRILSAALRCG